MRRLAELGVLGMAVPEEYGALGLPVRARWQMADAAGCASRRAVRTPAKLDMIDMRQAAFEKITSGVPDIDADNGKGFRHGFTLC